MIKENTKIFEIKTYEIEKPIIIDDKNDIKNYIFNNKY